VASIELARAESHRVGSTGGGGIRIGRWTSGGALVLVVMLSAVFLAITVGPVLWHASPTDQHAAVRLHSPSISYPLGTDQYGRDTLARILLGGRWTLLGAGIVTLGVTVIGLTIAAMATAGVRWIDITLSRAVDSLLAVPNLVIALAVASVLGPSYRNLIIALVAAGWPWYARAYRAAMMKERAAGYVEGAQVAGASRTRIALRHIGPNVAGHVMVLATTNLGFVILNLAALSFIGLGVQPPTPEWGAMINEARPFFQTYPVQMIVPGLCIVITVVLINLAGDALRDHLDPRLRGR
jgi:ABC-type dipeptide/oligopeptide/nickel transport system permease subunit